MGMTYKLAAQYAGIHPRTLMRFLAEGREASEGTKERRYYEEVKAAEADGAMVNMQRIHEAAQSGTWQASAWIMERRHGYTAMRADTKADAADAQDVSEAEDKVELDQSAVLEELRKIPKPLLEAALKGSGEG